jgi:signal transduction histidine kinase
MLDDLGLVASLKELCNRFSEQNPDTLLEFRSNTPRVEIPREVASCLYRVAQEGLQNLARHSDAEHASVALSIEKEGIVMLTIADDGAGFDLELVHGRGGLGMIGMEERAQLVHGKLTIATQPGHGTRIILKVPMLGGSL